MRLKIHFLFLIIFMGCFVIASTAKETSFPESSGFVNDYAGILSGEVKQKIESILEKIEGKTTAEVAIVTIDTLGSYTVEEYAVKLFQKWGIGKKGKDNGALVLVAVNERKIRIEVGYGLEGAITDLKSKMIIEDLMVPAFKKGNYALGILSCIGSLAKLIGKEYDIEIGIDKEMEGVPAGSTSASQASRLWNLVFLLVFLLIFGYRFWLLFFIWPKSGSKRRYWYGAGTGSYDGGFGGGGGFGGFGGGMSGGGGASGGW